MNPVPARGRRSQPRASAPGGSGFRPRCRVFQLAAGNAWADETGTAIATCDVALLLVSAAFLAFRLILGQEVPALLQRRQG